MEGALREFTGKRAKFYKSKEEKDRGRYREEGRYYVSEVWRREDT